MLRAMAWLAVALHWFGMISAVFRGKDPIQEKGDEPEKDAASEDPCTVSAADIAASHDDQAGQ